MSLSIMDWLHVCGKEDPQENVLSRRNLEAALNLPDSMK